MVACRVPREPSAATGVEFINRRGVLLDIATNSGLAKAGPFFFRSQTRLRLRTSVGGQCWELVPRLHNPTFGPTIRWPVLLPPSMKLWHLLLVILIPVLLMVYIIFQFLEEFGSE